MKLSEINVFKRVPYCVLIGLCCELVLGIIIVSNFVFVNYNLIELGKPSPYTIVATHSVSVVDTEETKRLQQQALSRVGMVYSLDPTILSLSVSKLKGYLFMKGIKRGSKEWKVSEKILVDLMKNGLYRWQLKEAIKKMQKMVNSYGFDEKTARIIKQALKYSIAANMLPDKEKTSELRLMIKRNVGNVVYKVEKGEVVVKKGYVVSRREILLLHALGLLPFHFPYMKVVGVFAFLFALLYILYMYLRKEYPELLYSHSMLVFFGVVALITVGVSRVASYFSPFFVPISFTGVAIAFLFDRRIAIFISVLTSLAVAFMLDGSFLIMSMGLVGGIIGIYFSSDVKQRIDLIRVGVTIGIVNIIVVFMVSMTLGVNIVNGVVNSLWAGGSGLLTAILISSLLPYFESAFELLSDIRLLELGMSDQPLLKRMQIEAPGTYHHSLNVANLAEQAAKSVGANPLLARVGAYYHDIGKLKRPYFFTENQQEGTENAMENIVPNLSILVIINHVKEGVELAKKYKLPQPIIDFILQHHGTSVIGYFYNRAKEELGEKQVDKDSFRYPGPKPRTKETAIVMLADAVEAAVRSLKTRNPAKMEALVRDVVREKLEDGQLDESDLRFVDIEKIVREFVRVLSGMYHTRIEYPDVRENAQNSL